VSTTDPGAHGEIGRYGSPQVITAPVTVRVGPVDLRLYPYNEVPTAPDDWDIRPWKWWAMVRLHFRIGELTTSKRVISRYSYHGPKAWPTDARPSDASLAEGRQAVLDNLRAQVARHGFDPPEFLIMETDETGSRLSDNGGTGPS
jgi:hypothetical protein